MKDILFSNNLHFHSYSYENNHHTNKLSGAPWHYFAYLETGFCRIVSEDRTIELQAGDLFYIPKGLRYHSYWYAVERIHFLSFGFHYFPEYGNLQYPLQKIACSEDVKNLFRAIPTEQSADSHLWGLFYTAVAAVLPCLEQRIANPRIHVIEQAKQYMFLHPEAKMADVAWHCKISESALYRVFREESGLTPNDLRQQLLCQRAVQMLTTTDRSVQVISDMLGFSSSSYFRKVFHKHIGKTPTQIRKAAGNF